MNPEDEIGFVADDEIGFVEDAPAPRMQPTRRIVMGETSITAGEPTRYDPSGERVETGHAVDADAPIAASPEPSWQERGKAAPTGPTVAQRARWEVTRGRTGDGGETPSAAWDAFIGATPQAGAFGADVSGARARTGERVQSFWDQMVLGNAQLGGRNPVDTIVGRDRRGEAPIAGISSTASLGFDDEAGGYLRSRTSGRSYEQERDALRQRSAEAQQQAPQTFAAGEAIGTLPAMAVNPATSGGRVALGAALGALGGAGHSEQTGIGLAEDTVYSGILGGTLAGLGETAGGWGQGPMRSLARRGAGLLRRGAEGAERLGTHARLEASGVWGGRAMRDVERTQGGASVFAADLRRYGIGERGRASVPVSTRAIEDAERLGESAVDTMGELARRGDTEGARVESATLLGDIDEIARRAEQLRTRTATTAAQRLREEFAAFQSAPDVDMSSAWRLRRHLDQQARWGTQAGDGQYVDLVREARRALDSRMDEAMADVGDDLLMQWNDASRRAQISAVMDNSGRGAQRLSSGGGMAGATGAGDVIAEAVQGRNPAGILPAMAQQGLVRGLAQYTRLRQPGITARVAETAATAQRSIADRLYALARSQPQQLGRFARPIMEAAARGSAALSATHFVLMQREREYRDLVEQLDAAEETSE